MRQRNRNAAAFYALKKSASHFFNSTSGVTAEKDCKLNDAGPFYILYNVRTAPKNGITEVEGLVVQKLNHATIRHRGVIDGGLFWVSF